MNSIVQNQILRILWIKHSAFKLRLSLLLQVLPSQSQTCPLSSQVRFGSCWVKNRQRTLCALDENELNHIKEWWCVWLLPLTCCFRAIGRKQTFSFIKNKTRKTCSLNLNRFFLLSPLTFHLTATKKKRKEKFFSKVIGVIFAAFILA